MLMFCRMPGGGAGGYGYAGAGAGGAGWSDIFDSIFRGEGAFGTDWGQGFVGAAGATGARARSRKGSDLSLTVDVTAEDAFRGTTHKVTYRIPSTGEQQTITVSVPAGAVDGGKLRYKRRGEYGTGGGERGDLVVTTHVEEHPLFKRKGADVTMQLAHLDVRGCAGLHGGRAHARRRHGAPEGARGHAGRQDVPLQGYGRARCETSWQKRGALLVKVVVQVPMRLSRRGAREARGLARCRRARLSREGRSLPRHVLGCAASRIVRGKGGRVRRNVPGRTR